MAEKAYRNNRHLLTRFCLPLRIGLIERSLIAFAKAFRAEAWSEEQSVEENHSDGICIHSVNIRFGAGLF